MTEAEINQLLDRHCAKMSTVAAGKKPPRVDWKGWIAVGLGILGIVAAFTMYVFKTNAAADLEHEQIKGARQLQGQRLDAQSKAVGEILTKIEKVTTNQIRIGERLKVGGLQGNDDP